MPTVMIAEDDLLMADMLEEVLVQNGYEVCGIARTVEEGVELGDRCKPDLAILDIRLAEGGLGMDIVARLHSRDGLGILLIGNVVSRADESSPQGRAFITGKPVICSNVNTDVSFVLPTFYAEHGIISTIDVVINKEGQPYGVLEIDSPIEQDYDRHDVNFLTGFANILAEAANTADRNAVVQRTIEQMRVTVADRDGLLTRQNALLAEKTILLDDKEVMGRELQHRVRNNLQLVHSMLNKQLQSDQEGTSNEGIRAIARRVMALSEVYDHLLGAGLSRTIDFGGYLSSLCTGFAELENSVHPNVALTCQIEPAVLDLDNVTALGLVVSELIANSYGHAFPTGTGTISVSLHRNDSGNEATLVFADNGVGFVEAGNSKRQGVGLVRRLMQQVGGSATLKSQHGSEWTLKFPVPQGTSGKKPSSRPSLPLAPELPRQAQTAGTDAPPRPSKRRKKSGGTPG